MTNSIVVSWTPPVEQDIMIRGYILGYGVGVPDIYKQVLDPKQRYHTIKNLGGYQLVDLYLRHPVLTAFHVLCLQSLPLSMWSVSEHTTRLVREGRSTRQRIPEKLPVRTLSLFDYSPILSNSATYFLRSQFQSLQPPWLLRWGWGPLSCPPPPLSSLGQTPRSDVINVSRIIATTQSDTIPSQPASTDWSTPLVSMFT